jgi:hypothetical protein
MRTDIHRLFDVGKITLTPERERIMVNITGAPSYQQFHGGEVAIPKKQRFAVQVIAALNDRS